MAGGRSYFSRFDKKFFMKKLSLFILVAIVFLGIKAPAFAEDESGDNSGSDSLNRGKRIELKEKLSEKRNEIKDIFNTKKEEVAKLRAEMEAKRTELVGKIEKFDNRVASAEKRADMIIKAIERAHEKVAELIANVNAKGIDTAAATAKLDESKASLEKVRVSFESARALYANIDSTKTLTKEEAKSLRAEFKKFVDQAKVDLKAAKELLRDSVRALKDAIKAKRAENKAEKENTNGNDQDEDNDAATNTGTATQ